MSYKYVSFLKENRTKEQAQTIYNQRISDAREVFDKYSDSFFYRSCPICGEDDTVELEKFDGRYKVVKCQKCASLYVNPCPSLEALSYYYNECKCNEQLGSLLVSRVGKKGTILNERGKLTISVINKLLTNHQKIKVLDVGCHSGAFIFEIYKHLKEKDIQDRVELVGIDIEKKAIENPVSDKINLFHSSVEEYVEGRHEEFDLIIHFELIEHLQNPFDFMVAIRNLLKKNGATYFQTPNALGLDNQAIGYNDFRPLAHGIFPPMHLQAFTTQNIMHFLLRAGLRLGEISTPGNFDVDMVRQFIHPEMDPVFKEAEKLDERSLAIFQQWLKKLSASSALAVLAWK